MRGYSDPRIGDLAHGILSLLRAKFQSFGAFVSLYQSLQINEVACKEDTDTSLFNITASGWHQRSLAVSAGIFLLICK